MALTGEIRMIQYGVIRSQDYFAISVDQPVGGVSQGLKVVAIIREYIEGNDAEYHIECVKKRIPTSDNSSEWTKSFVWTTYYKKPDFVQYFSPDDKHDYIKI